MQHEPSDPFELVIIGAGPRGIGVLERLSANATELLRGPHLERGVRVHLVDPHPPGPGRIWRYRQSPLLRMNSMLEDVTMFTDDTVVMDGPIRPGPSLAEWARLVRSGEIDHAVPAALAAELRDIDVTAFPTRRLQSLYLDWVYRSTAIGLPDGVTVRVHPGAAVGLEDITDSRQRVRLADGRQIDADAVVLTVGHIDAEPDDAARRLAGFAARHDVRYHPPGYTADVDYTGVPAGEPVLVRGMGLAFVDLMLLLTEGRGGRFVEQSCGGLRYLPSGGEPLLHVGSRRGVPYHAKIGYKLRGDPPVMPRYFDERVVAELIERPGALDFHRDIWPHIAKEVAWGFYSELLGSHPERVLIGRTAFTEAFDHTPWGSPELTELVTETIPAEEDRFDPASFDRPLTGVRVADTEELGKLLRDHIETDLARRADPHFSADLGAFQALLSVFARLMPLLSSGRLDGTSQLADVDGWWFGFFSFFASGPPPRRLAELLALQQAGIVTFLGAGMRVAADESTGSFIATTDTLPEAVRTRTLIEARLPSPSLARARDPLLRTMLGAGTLTEETVPDTRSGTPLPTGRIRTRVTDGRLLDPAGAAHPRLFALGPHTSSRSPGAFTRPRTNAASFRQNDVVAREILDLIRSR